MENGLRPGGDGVMRCWWCGDAPDYVAYHDQEWGRPVRDDRRLFEKLSLEAFQSGLSWLTILRKREGFRRHFAGFDFRELAGWGEPQVLHLLEQTDIVRHRKKIEATLGNARRALELVSQEGSLSDFFWSFQPPPEERPARKDYQSLRALGQTPGSVRLSKELKRRGWIFVGPTTVYAFMQAAGIVNDHLDGCHYA